MTICHFDIKPGQKKMKFGMISNYETGNSYMTFDFEIDQIFINYSEKVTCGHFAIKDC